MTIQGSIAILVFGLSLAACRDAAQTRNNPPPQRPPQIVRFGPSDLATSVGLGPFEIVLTKGMGSLGDSLLRQVAGAVRLVTWPELASVATKTSLADASNVPDGEHYAHIFVRSTAPLVDRWYALTVDDLPGDLAWPGKGHQSVARGRARVVRFRVGSDARLANVRVFTKSSTQWVAYADFSETITGDINLVNLSYADATPADCRVSNPQLVPSPIPRDGSGIILPPGISSEGVTTVQFICKGAVDPGRALQVDVRPGLAPAMKGGAIGGISTRFVMNIGEATSLPDGGRLWKRAEL
jgi:hypothetical protein